MPGDNITTQHSHTVQQHDPLKVIDEDATKSNAPHNKRGDDRRPEVKCRAIDQHPKSIESNHDREPLGGWHINIHRYDDQEQGQKEPYVESAQQVARIGPYPFILPEQVNPCGGIEKDRNGKHTKEVPEEERVEPVVHHIKISKDGGCKECPAPNDPALTIILLFFLGRLDHLPDDQKAFLLGNLFVFHTINVLIGRG